MKASKIFTISINDFAGHVIKSLLAGDSSTGHHLWFMHDCDTRKSWYQIVTIGPNASSNPPKNYDTLETAVCTFNELQFANG